MLLYTALTRARNHLYLIEINEHTALTRARNHLYLIEINEFGAQNGLGRSRGRTTSTACVGLDDFAFLRLKDLDLLKIIKSIHEGFVEMTPAQHKTRGVLLVTQTINLSRAKSSGSAISDSSIKTKVFEAADRLSVDKGND
jgi:ATP-dependent exoDNAse (exonuclease V) beta subunit